MSGTDVKICFSLLFPVESECATIMPAYETCCGWVLILIGGMACSGDAGSQAWLWHFGISRHGRDLNNVSQVYEACLVNKGSLVTTVMCVREKTGASWKWTERRLLMGKRNCVSARGSSAKYPADSELPLWWSELQCVSSLITRKLNCRCGQHVTVVFHAEYFVSVPHFPQSASKRRVSMLFPYSTPALPLCEIW